MVCCILLIFSHYPYHFSRMSYVQKLSSYVYLIIIRELLPKQWYRFQNQYPIISLATLYMMQISIIYNSLLVFNCLITRNAIKCACDILWYDMSIENCQVLWFTDCYCVFICNFQTPSICLYIIVFSTYCWTISYIIMLLQQTCSY